MQLTDQMVKEYQKNGVIKITQIITEEEATYYRKLALTVLQDKSKIYRYDAYADRLMIRFNMWLESPEWKKLTLHPNVVAVAEKLSGSSLRLWHDHILVKRPHNNLATEFHQDQTKWPHNNSLNALSAWIALQDTQVEMGCMTFIPGSHSEQNLPDVKISMPNGYENIWPLANKLKMTIPLKAGDCTFHHCRTIHMAGKNQTNRWRVAHVVIFMDTNTTYCVDGNQIPSVLKPNEFKDGDLIAGDHFPELKDYYGYSHL